MSGQSQSFEWSHLRYDGSPLETQVSLNPIQLNGKTYIQAIVRDITERKQAEEKLRESEKRLKILFESAPDAYYIHDLEGRFIDGNRTAEKLVGYQKEEAIEKTLFELGMITGTDVPKVLQAMADNREGKLGGPLELAVHCKDGREVIVETRSYPVEIGGETLVLGIARDITERKQIEERLRQSEQRYRAVVEGQTELICRYRPDGTITFANDAYCRYFHKSRDELIGHKFMPRIPEADHPKVKEHFVSLGRENPIATHEHRALTPDGEICWHQWTNRIILNDAGQITEFQGTGRDITKEKLAEERLKESEKRFRNLSEAAFEGIVFSEKGMIVDTNEAFARIFGYGLKELKRKKVIELVAPEDRTRVSENIRSDYEEIYEPKGLREDGSVVDLEVQGRNVIYQGRKMRLTAVRDITERKRAEKRLQQYQAKLKSLASELALAEERERRRIAAGIHDDMAQKLAMTKLELQSLGASISDKSVGLSLEAPCSLIDEIVQDARELVFNLSNAALHQVGLEAAVESWLQHDIQGKHALKCELVKDTSGRKLDDNTQIILFRALKELVANAVKYAEAHRITVLIQEADGTIRVSVEDDGVGFDPSGLEASFTPKGGFGLFNIKERLEYLGGRLDIDSGPGEGTRVTMTAPLKQDSTVR